MVDVDNWTVTCKNCGTNYDIPKTGKITILSLEKIKFKKSINALHAVIPVL